MYACKKLNVFRHADIAFMARHIVSVTSSKTGAGAHQHHVLFICCERHLGEQVVNKERLFQEVAKGK